MKLEPVAKLHKANTATSRKGNDVMLANCSITVIFPVYLSIWNNAEALFWTHDLYYLYFN